MSSSRVPQSYHFPSDSDDSMSANAHHNSNRNHSRDVSSASSVSSSDNVHMPHAGRGPLGPTTTQPVGVSQPPTLSTASRAPPSAVPLTAQGLPQPTSPSLHQPIQETEEGSTVPSPSTEVHSMSPMARKNDETNNGSSTSGSSSPALQQQQRRGVSFMLHPREVKEDDAVRPLPSAAEGTGGRYRPQSTRAPAMKAADPALSPSHPPHPNRGLASSTTAHQHGNNETDATRFDSANGEGSTFVVVDGPRRRRRPSTTENSTDASHGPRVNGSSSVSVSVGLETPTASSPTGQRAVGWRGGPPPQATASPRTRRRASQSEATGGSASDGGGVTFLVDVGSRRDAEQQGTRLPYNALDASTLLRAQQEVNGEEEDAETEKGEVTGMTLEDAIPTGPMPYSAAAQVERSSAGTFTQLLALVERTARQYWRSKLSLLAEVIVPLIFVVLIVLLDVAFGSESLKETNPFLFNQLPYQFNDKDYMTYLCYKGPEPIGNLAPCAILNASDYNCEGDESGLPVKGLCYVTVFPNMQVILAQYVSGLTSDLIALPTLDSIIAHQWIAKKARLAADSRSRSAMAALSSAGLGVSSSTRYESITYSGRLLFAPRANIPSDLFAYFMNVSAFFPYVYGGIFDTVADAEAYAAQYTNDVTSNESIWGIVVVKEPLTASSTNFDVQIQLHRQALPEMRPTVSLNYRTGYNFDGSDMYLASGYMSLQRTLYDYFLQSRQRAGALPATSFNTNAAYPIVAPFPSIAGERKYIVDLAAPLIAFVVVLAYLYPFSQMTKRLVLEKELRIREAMLIMGLTRTALWLCHGLLSLLQLLVTSVLLTILLCATVATRSDPFVIALILIVYSCSLVPLVGLVSTLFSKARLAALLSPLLYFVLSMLIFSMVNASEEVTLGLSIFSPTALAALLTAVMTGEGGSGFSARDFSGNPFYVPLPYKIMLMLTGDVFIYLLVMLYLDAVLPQEWGSTRHPLFFVVEPYRAIRRKCSDKTKRSETEKTEGEDETLNSTGTSSHTALGRVSKDTNAEASHADRFDPSVGLDNTTGERKTASITMDRLVKRYKRSGKTFTAVNSLSWQLYPGEISVLLGPNGSGKSTTINMLTGMLAPDGGDCTLAGYSVREALDEARHEIGFCPQHNILWPDLTCREHLEFFGRIKGLRGAALEDAVTDVLRAVDLAEKIDSTPSMLSGGQKRKLSVAIAFVGRNGIVLLDEPTAGMDVAARRHTWSLLRAMAPNRTILLTTHYMDEADLLGDHIAIISDGEMRCAGSSLFLRSHAGSGYTLRFDLLPLAPDAYRSFQGTRAQRLRQKWELIARSVRRHVPEAAMTLQTSTEVEFRIPLTYEAQLPALLRELETQGNRAMGIRSYALSAPSLEDVFMNIVEAAHLEALGQQQDPSTQESHDTRRGDNNPRQPRRTTTTPIKSTGSPGGVTSSTTDISSPEAPPTQPGVTPRRASTSGNTLPGPLLYRRMSRASMRFVNGDDDGALSSGRVMTPVITFAEPDTDDHEDEDEDSGGDMEGSDAAGLQSAVFVPVGPPSSGGGGGGGPLDLGGFDGDVFGRRIESPTGQSRVDRGRLELDTLRSRTPQQEASDAGDGEMASSVFATRLADGWQYELPGVLGSPAQGAKEKREGVAVPRTTWSEHSMGDTSTDDLAPLKALASKADQGVEYLWRVRPVERTAQRWALQLEAMLYKRFFYSLRDRRMQFFQVACPVLCILLAMLLQLVNVRFTGSLTLDAPQLFQAPTQLSLSRCTRMLGTQQALQATFPPERSDPVLFDTRDFYYGADLADHLLDTWYVHAGGRYAAAQCDDPVMLQIMQQNFPDSTRGRVPYVVMYNTSSHHSLPYAFSALYHLLYAHGLALAGNTTEDIQAAVFRTEVKALPLTSSDRKTASALASIMIGIIVLIPFTFLPANPVAWVVKEREIRARHLQKLSGLPYLLYWLGNFIFDFLAYLVSMILVIVVFAIFQRWEYVGRDTIGPIIVSFLLYGLCCCTGSYAVNFFFTEHTTAQVVVMGVSFLTGFVCVVLVFILSLMDWTLDASNVMRWIFRVIPSYAVGEVILSLALLDQTRLTQPELQPWSMRVSGWADVYMAAEVPVFIAITLLWDHPNRHAVVQRIKDGFHRCWCCCCRRGERDVPAVAVASPAATPVTAAAVGETADVPSPASPSRAAQQRQQLAAQAEARCRSDTLLRRQSAILYPGSDPAQSARAAFEPSTEQEPGVALLATGRPPYGSHTPTQGRRPSTHKDGPKGSTSPPPHLSSQPSSPPLAKDAGGRRGRTAAAVPTLVVPDLVASAEAGAGPASPSPTVAVSVRSTTAAARDRTASTTAAHPPPVSYMYPAPKLEEEDHANKAEEDSDVEDERLAVYEDERRLNPLDVVRFVDLRKVYPNGKVAVRGLTFGVMPGEVFGFLGTNGAGKSTALSILTQEQQPTSGRAYVCGHDVVRESGQAMRSIGYCPQFDACFDLLTVEEHLAVYARVRGIAAAKRKELVQNLLELCDLVMYKDVLSHELSGGNRRKLSVAVALLGAPEVVCLDEPSAGMDPIARRLLWRALDRVSKKCSIVLTTHHLEEVEALADTVAIMVDGGLRCIGDLPHLKHKYARNAYELNIRVGTQTRYKEAGNPAAHAHATDNNGAAESGEATQGASLSRSASLNVLSFAGRREASIVSTPDTGTSGGGGHASPSSAAQRLRRRSQSITYAGVNFVDAENGVVQFMAQHLPSALLVENFNDERFTYSVPATRDVAAAMAMLQEQMLREQQRPRGNGNASQSLLHRRRSSTGTCVLGTSLSRAAMSPSFRFPPTQGGSHSGAARNSGGGGAGASGIDSGSVSNSPSYPSRQQLQQRLLSAAAAARIVRLSDVFQLLQAHQARLGVTEYSVSQVSLEQVFLRVANDSGDKAGATPKPNARGANTASSPQQRKAVAASPTAAASPVSVPRPRANSLYHALSVRGRAGSLSLNYPDLSHVNNTVSFYGGRGSITYPSGQGSAAQRGENGEVGEVAGVKFRGAYAQYRRVRAQAKAAMQAAENERRQSSEPDHME